MNEEIIPQSRDESGLQYRQKMIATWAAPEALVGGSNRIALVAHFEKRVEAMDGKARSFEGHVSSSSF